MHNKNSSGDEIANVNFYAFTPLKVIQGHRFWYHSKAHMQLPIIIIIIYYVYRTQSTKYKKYTHKTYKHSD